MRTIVLLSFITICALGDSKAFEISKANTQLIALRVFKNECSVEKDCLLEWGINENFLSLGLEHFIWYPAHAPSIFKEGFRSYLQYAKETGERLPVWMDKTPFPPCPWSSREEFIKAQGSPQYNDLRDFILRTKHCQIKYLIENTKRSLVQIIAASPDDQRKRITQYLSQLTSDPQGLYAIIDYLNFKGPGIGNSDEVKGERWGLLQVLEGMKEMATPRAALEEFVRSAKVVLTHRVFYAPVEKHEDQWLQGWLRRIDSYLEN